MSEKIVIISMADYDLLLIRINFHLNGREQLGSGNGELE
jgi:hypothetical protein